MYRLVAFEATNISGFKSGLGKKTFRLDLRKLLSKDIIVILGNNATGKSTFLSLVHPTHTPSDKKQRFVIEGKEGLIIHEYLGDDGTEIITKAIYTPKGDSHTAKLYFKLIRGDVETELNPNGNVSSYYALIDTYFGVNKEYIQFASYNDVVKGIVKMTDTERKLSVSTLIPNTSRFETAYSIINEKYRDLNNTLRNLSQKIIHLGNEDALTRDLKRHDKDIKSYNKRREELVKEIASCEGQIKEMTGGKSIKELKADYQYANNRLIGLTASMVQQLREIRNYCDLLAPEKITDDNMLNIASRIIRGQARLDSKIKACISSDRENQEALSTVRSRISKVENQLDEYEASIFSLQCQSPEEMESVRAGLEFRLQSMEYTANKDKYRNMTYEEAKSFMDHLAIIANQIDVHFERYGPLVNLWFSGDYSRFETAENQIDAAYHLLAELRQDLEYSYRKIAEYNSHAGLKDILAKRPATCTDDSCPFIAKALAWDEISAKLTEETTIHEEIRKKIEEQSKLIEEYRLLISASESLLNLNRMMQSQSDLFQKYFNVSLESIYIDISHGQIPTLFNLDKIKQIAAVLSEKDLHDRIVNVDLPNIKKQIELSKNVEKNRSLILRSIDQLRSERESLSSEMHRLQNSITINQTMLTSYQGRLDMVMKLSDVMDRYQESSVSYDELTTRTEATNSIMEKVLKLSDKIDADSEELRRLDYLVKELLPVRDRLYYDLMQLKQLELEKAVVDRDFLIVSLMRRMVGPGKGIWKEAIDIYMQDINAIANQLLLHMFNGNLSLNDFIIDDKKFIIPYTFNGNEGPDISYASSSQQTTISNAISLAIISKLLDKYGILTFDEVDKDLSPANKEIFVKILATQMRYIGIQQCFIITHNPTCYEPYDVGYILFPGAVIDDRDERDCIEVK